MNEPPRCPSCHEHLLRIDHFGIEHTILDNDVYRAVAIADGSPGAQFGLASETDLRCGYCGTSVPREVREYFYRRWEQVLAFTPKLVPSLPPECGG